MATITVRNLDAEVQRLLKQRAAANNRSMEAEARAILTESVQQVPFLRNWIAAAEPLRGDFVLPKRTASREAIDFS